MSLPAGWKKNKKGSCKCESREGKQRASLGCKGHGLLGVGGAGGGGVSTEHFPALSGELQVTGWAAAEPAARTSHHVPHSSCPAQMLTA